MKTLNQKKKIYFASDTHLGLPTKGTTPLEREKKLVAWLDSIKDDAEEIFLVGDIFDYWYEYKKVVPRGFTRFLGKISELCDSGITIHFFTGNHDIWVFDYLPTETGVIVHKEPITRIFNNKKFYIAHGDGLGPYDKSYRLLKKLFTNKILQWMFSRLHPNFTIMLAHKWSQKSRHSQGISAKEYRSDEKEWLYLYSKSILEKEHFDYFIYGHRHIVVERKLLPNSYYINLGDWISNFSYGVFDGENFELRKFQE